MSIVKCIRLMIKRNYDFLNIFKVKRSVDIAILGN